ncbi:MAG: hypothetical protein RQ714_05385 [Nitrosomonas sp.]|nr:hypothetical protein [Nitrosomonas sp.]
MQKILSRIVVLLLTLLTAAGITIGTFFYLAIDSKPQVTRDVRISHQHIARAKSILDTHRYQVRPGTTATASIDLEDFDIALNYLAHHLGQGRAKSTLRNQGAHIQISLPVPAIAAVTNSAYVNFETLLIESKNLPTIKSLRIGKLAVPDNLANFALQQLFSWLKMISPDVRTGMDAFRKIGISHDGIAISYYWQGWENRHDDQLSLNLPLFDQQTLERLLRYHTFLNQAYQQHDAQTVALSEILTRLMQETTRAPSHANATEEIRAAILVASFHVLQLPLKLITPEAAKWQPPARINITLDGRADFAMHFIASAAIAAYTDTVLSDAIGLYKELEDARSGSGFSFNDIAANRAGTSFAAKITDSQSSARKIRANILAGINDSDLMPYWADLPEHLDEKIFLAKFGGTHTATYQELIHKIEQRVSSLRLLRQ